MDAGTETIEALKIKFHPHSAMARVLDEPGKVTRQRSDQPQELANCRLTPSQCFHRLITLCHCAIEKWLNAVDQTELRIILATKSFECNERFEQESQIRR